MKQNAWLDAFGGREKGSVDLVDFKSAEEAACFGGLALFSKPAFEVGLGHERVPVPVQAVEHVAGHVGREVSGLYPAPRA